MMTLLVIFIGGKVNQSIMEEIHIQTINGFDQKVVMRAKKRAVIDATKTGTLSEFQLNGHNEF